MILKLEDIRTGKSLCVNSNSVKCFYPEGKEGTVMCLELLDEDSQQRGCVIKVKEAFQDIFETLQACWEALQAVPKVRRDKDAD